MTLIIFLLKIMLAVTFGRSCCPNGNINSAGSAHFAISHKFVIFIAQPMGLKDFSVLLFRLFMSQMMIFNPFFSSFISGALINAVFLVALCFSISVESFKRFYESEDIHNPKLILVVGALGLLVNLLGLCLFAEHGGGHGHSHGGGGKKKPVHHGTHR